MNISQEKANAMVEAWVKSLNIYYQHTSKQCTRRRHGIDKHD